VRERLESVGAGVLCAAATYLVDPTPQWWTVGAVVTAVLLVNPLRPRR
jgi:hypothetical protein